MDMPRELANMLGIVLNAKKPKPAPLPRDEAIKSEFKDGVLTLSYGGDVMGWVNNINQKTIDGTKYRALSIHGEVKHCREIAGAKEFICSKYN